MPPQPPPARTVLFVDDESVNHDLFGYQFGEKWNILSAFSGDEALQLFKAHPEVGVIVSDLKMPGMDGIELLTRIFRLNPDTVRIIVTGHARFESVLQAINSGHIYQYILKPWDAINFDIALEQGFKNWTLITENRRLILELHQSNVELQLLSEKLINSQERERKRIAMDLHDGIGQNLIALKLQLRSLNSLLQEKTNDYEVFDTISTISDTLQHTIDDTRNLSRNLSPAMIEDFGFDSALDEFLRNFERDYAMQTEGSRVKLEPLFDQKIQHQLYRIIQEIFNNIGKHSGSDSVCLNMSVGDSALEVAISDHGCGFNLDEGDELTSTHGLGLTTIKERATLLGGSVRIDSILNLGTRFTVTIPFPGDVQHN